MKRTKFVTSILVKTTTVAMALSMCANMVASSSTCPCTRGDVNGDQMVDASDASEVLSHYAVLSTGGDVAVNLCLEDVNRDGMVDASDASSILAYYAMLSTGGSPNWPAEDVDCPGDCCKTSDLSTTCVTDIETEQTETTTEATTMQTEQTNTTTEATTMQTEQTNTTTEIATVPTDTIAKLQLKEIFSWEVKVAPDFKSEKKTEIAGGTVLFVISRDERWWHVYQTDGTEGYVYIHDDDLDNCWVYEEL